MQRNEPCRCGSGQKYKRCCLPKDRQDRADIENAIARLQIVKALDGLTPVESGLLTMLQAADRKASLTH